MSIVSRLLALLLTAGLAAPQAALAEIVTTTEALAQQGYVDAGAARNRLQSALARETVREELQAFGVDPERAEQRVAALSDAEAVALADKVDSAPAGSGVLAAVGVTFVVLIILEAVGVIDVFKKI